MIKWNKNRLSKKAATDEVEETPDEVEENFAPVGVTPKLAGSMRVKPADTYVTGYNVDEAKFGVDNDYDTTVIDAKTTGVGLYNKGFTLIELMIVVAIIGILAAIAIPAYQDYTIRAQVSEGLSLASAAKASVAEYYVERGAWPSNNDDAGLADKHDIMGKYTEHVSVKDNVIEIKYEYDANVNIHGDKIDLTATNNDGSISWTCAGDGIADKHLPAACR